MPLKSLILDNKKNMLRITQNMFSFVFAFLNCNLLCYYTFVILHKALIRYLVKLFIEGAYIMHSFSHFPLSTCKFSFFSFTAALLLTAPSFSFAQTPTTPLPEITKLHLSVDGIAQAEPDEITAVFRAEAQNKSATTAQQSVNTQINNALKVASTVNGVKSAASHYSVFQSQPNKVSSFWIAQQILTLTANNTKNLLPLVGTLQARGLILEKLEWSLSEPKRQATLLEAEKNALANLTQQTDVIATSLKRHVTLFETLNFLESSSLRPMPVMFARSAMAVSPMRTQETQSIRVRCDATAILVP